MSKARPTLHDVGKLAGVSAMTVSRVINGGIYVRPAYREAVERAIRELNYTPNMAAKALVMKHQPHRVAILFDTPNSAMIGKIIGVSPTHPSRSGVELVFIRADSADDPLDALTTIQDLGIEGVILAPPLCDDARLRIVLADAGKRIVLVGCGDPSPQHSAVGIDDRQAAFDVTRYLLQLGHRRIGFIAGHPRHQSSARRRAGYQAALTEHGITPDPALQWEGAYTFGSALGVAEEVLSLDEPVTAVFASNDDMAAAVISIARGRGVAVPRELTVCGFDDSEIAVMISPQLTTARQPVDDMVTWALSRIALELNAIARGEKPPIERVTLEHTMSFRESDAPPPRT